MSTAACPKGQLLSRHLPAWQDQPLNLVAVGGDFSLSGLLDLSGFTPALQVWSADWRLSKQAEHLGCKNYFVSVDHPQTLSGRSVLLWPKSKEEGYWWLQQLAALKVSSFYLLGENQGGVKAAAKHLSQAGLQVSKVDSARRCSLFLVQADDTFASQLPTTAKASWISGPDGLQLFNQPGVFSQGRVDEGSALLLEALAGFPPTPSTKGGVLDLGCGNGLLGAWFIKHYPEWELLASDVNGFALMATQQTLKANDLAGTTQAADVFSGLAESCPPASLDRILTNPPFHTGKGTDYGPAERLIREAAYYLKPGGELWVVANRFLPYPDLLQAAFGGFTCPAQTGKFSVYRAINQRSPS